MANRYWHITREGLWDNNIVFTQALGLCPLLAVTNTATNGLGLGLASTVVFITSAVLISFLRDITTPQIRIPIFVLTISVLVTLVDMSMNAWLHELHKGLGLFIPLIVTNCAILGRAEAFASRNTPLPSLVDGMMMGLGFTLALVVLGVVREVIGSGTVFADATLLLGDWARFLEIKLASSYEGLLLMILPPGGFLALAFILAGKRILDSNLSQRQPEPSVPATSSGDAA